MQNNFDSLIDSYILNKVGISDHFLSETLAQHLKENLLSHLLENNLKAAGIGNGSLLVENKLIRSDKIFWLDRKHNDLHENNFFDLIDDFVSYLNRTCYTGITSYEFHYALYEKGNLYKKHLDQFKSDNSRQFTMIMYLNVDWIEADGGELCIYQNDVQQKIAPINCKGIFFKSNELEHEVLVTNKQRLSITGWLKIN